MLKNLEAKKVVMTANAGRYSLTYVNEKNEAFHVHILATPATVFDQCSAQYGKKSNTIIVSEDAPCTSAVPVLFCVHGAGMSGDNFIRLAEHLCQTLP